MVKYSRMKILFASSSFNGGGITSYALEVIECYSAENEITVFVSSKSKIKVNNAKVKVVDIDCSNTSINYACEVIRLINEDVKPDVIINSNAVLITLIAPFIDDRVRIISVSHSLKYKEVNIAAYNNKYIDTIIALSGYNKRYIEKRFGIKKNNNKTKYIGNFLSEIPERDAIIEEKKKQVFSIVFAGGSSQAKTPEVVLRVLKKLIKTKLDFKFIWIGDDTPLMRRFQPYKRIRNLVPPDERVSFLGRVNREEAESIIGHSNIFLSPSRREGCPIALLEAIRIGTIPIVAEYENANREIVVDGKNGFMIYHKDTDGYVAKIIDIIQNRQKYERIYDLSYQTFIDGFSYSKWREAMDSVIADESYSHARRQKVFSKQLYTINKMKYNFINKLDNVDMFFREKINTSISLLIEYFKYHR